MNVPEAAHPPIILASESPRRRMLPSQIVTAFEVVASYAAESGDRSLSPRRLCEINAERKAWLVAGRYPGHLVVGADTLVFLDGQPLGKPADLAGAQAMLSQLSGRIHEVITGVALVHREGARMRIFSDATFVKFRTLSPAQIDDYLGRVNVLDKAGAYAIQEHGELIIETIEGSHSNVVGLPLEMVRAALQTWSQAGLRSS